MRERMRKTSKVIANRTRGHNDTIARIAQGKMFNFLRQSNALIQRAYFVESVEEQEHCSTCEQLFEHPLVDLNAFSLQQYLGSEGEKIIVMLPTFLRKATKLDVQRHRMPRYKRQIEGRRI